MKRIWTSSVRRMKEYDDLKKIVVNTNELFVPAKKNCESVGFVKVCERENKETPFSGNYIDYEIVLSSLPEFKRKTGR